MTFAPLPDLLWEPIVRTGLLEDLGTGGDVTTQALAPPDATLRAMFRVRRDGVLAGLAAARLSFALLEPEARFEAFAADGDVVTAGQAIAVVEARAETVLAGERTALNLLSHLSGIATATREVVTAVAGTQARVCCTRKTLPGLRAAQKYAVRAGGGSNHRYRLDDAILIKDNHIALCGGVHAALAAARARAGHLMAVELEVDTLEQLAEAIAEKGGGADAYLLDNMTPLQLREAVRMIGGRAIAEASGGITPGTARDIAETGVDVLSLGWLTHSVTALDIGLDIDL
ncbi:carboxylating nicotinate-nucleotide diphosphorylase [Acidomonas methanolica]|uniref:Probable nicotinate-nucleotide pyrophosphorylase [carboxylating] n=2 Tax=Acidomonas methanolica TaxID=437 RepID=A0A023D4H3_ACIMT|nr:carboxylating nicotinate-nucleotide diphosphorylase [Acidomonas methanolica]MBU2653949.1 carboxylating nicotinate-nucleotide diphosphorylase [Acidomonas methanolica]TCS30910.1 nicotinate-nucleotide pyrophosphorylase [carboxylating] [Acidomonas methanolica]GAJ28681.1 nicotinate-nucleotide pyrophosphorylase [Acidomonas methanolica NBRC 104435]GEK98293.1 nicotinate-nucleotide diphosphorylase (carboxylating) [Acidomonas methanolica NBRC 104435]